MLEHADNVIRVSYLYIIIYRTASLLRPARCYAPPPISVRNYLMPPRGPLEPVCSTAVLARVRVLQVHVEVVYQACRK